MNIRDFTTRQAIYSKIADIRRLTTEDRPRHP